MFVCCLLCQESLEKEILNLNENISGKLKANKKINKNAQNKFYEGVQCQN
jgi:hypothetical protein